MSLKNFLPHLQAHLLPRLKASFQKNSGCNIADGSSLAALHEPQQDDASFVSIQHSRIYSHKVMRIRYTTYDVRRAEDVVRLQGGKTNVMACRPDFDGTGHPFIYGRVLGIYHVNAILACNRSRLEAERLDFLWIRWYRLEANEDFGDAPLLSFLDVTDDSAFGFLNPEDVVRGSHIIPRFSLGTVVDEVGLSQKACDGNDYLSYYVNRQVLTNFAYASPDCFQVP
jgi:hypothetical protein